MCFLYFREEEGEWIEDNKLEGHSDWVRDVAWAPSIGLPKSIIASCSQVINTMWRNLSLSLVVTCYYYPPTSEMGG